MTKEKLKWYKEDLKSYDFCKNHNKEDKEQEEQNWIDNFLLL